MPTTETTPQTAAPSTAAVYAARFLIAGAVWFGLLVAVSALADILNDNARDRFIQEHGPVTMENFTAPPTPGSDLFDLFLYATAVALLLAGPAILLYRLMAGWYTAPSILLVATLALMAVNAPANAQVRPDPRKPIPRPEDAAAAKRAAMPPDKMTVAQLRQEVTRLRAERSSYKDPELDRLRTENLNLRRDLLAAQRLLDRTGLSSSQPAATERELRTGQVYARAIGGLHFSEVDARRIDSRQDHIVGIIHNRSGNTYQNLIAITQVVQAADGTLLNTETHTISGPLQPGEQKRFSIWVDAFKGSRTELIAYGQLPGPK